MTILQNSTFFLNKFGEKWLQQWWKSVRLVARLFTADLGVEQAVKLELFLFLRGPMNRKSETMDCGVRFIYDFICDSLVWHS